MVVSIQGERGGTPGHSTRFPSPQEKLPGRHAREALLLFLGPLIRRVCQYVCSYCGAHLRGGRRAEGLTATAGR